MLTLHLTGPLSFKSRKLLLCTSSKGFEESTSELTAIEEVKNESCQHQLKRSCGMPCIKTMSTDGLAQVRHGAVELYLSENLPPKHQVHNKNVLQTTRCFLSEFSIDYGIYEVSIHFLHVCNAE
jgi:hypothetical protein